jgi:putative nucleotidyltransferase with HDIG domain
MRGFDKANALVLGVVMLGAATAAVAAERALGTPIAILALLGAAVVVTELIQVPKDDSAVDPADATSFSFSSSVHLAAALVAGPWVAALVAAFGVLAVDPLRSSRGRAVAYNASVFALAAAAAGLVYDALAEPGRVSLPGDLGALAALALVYYALNTLLVGWIVALTLRVALRPLVRGALWNGLPSALGEAALGFALARAAISEPWAIVALVPLVFAVYHSHARLAILRRETAHALETFANVVDERDPSTFEHSARVAHQVGRLAHALGVPASQVARIRWAGRLHDLGKIAVDATVLRKPGRLDAAEWTALRRHPRLSARLLRRFRFADGEARAVEYHHERYDGLGYYGVDAAEIPLGAHFLIVADSFDAMTSDRSYRKALPHDAAVDEIEAGAGTQFHPVVAKAFVAMERGLEPASVLAPGELAALRRVGAREWPSVGRIARALRRRRESLAAVALAASLTAVGIGNPVLAAVAAAAAAAVLGTRTLERIRARRLASRLGATVSSHPAGVRLDALAQGLSLAAPLRWAGLVAWDERDGGASVEGEWGERCTAPSETALGSWLLRDAEEAGGLAAAEGAELGVRGRAIGVRLSGCASGAYAVLLFSAAPPGHVELALELMAADVGAALASEIDPARRSVPDPAPGEPGRAGSAEEHPSSAKAA